MACPTEGGQGKLKFSCLNISAVINNYIVISNLKKVFNRFFFRTLRIKT